MTPMFELELAQIPLNAYTNAKQASFIVPGNLLVYGWTVYNTKAANQFLNVFAASALPADGAVPLFSWVLAANSGITFSWAPNGRRFHAGLVLCNSSTDATKTIGAADCFFDVQYSVLDSPDSASEV